MKRLASSIAPRRGKKRQLEDMIQEQEERRCGRGELLSEDVIQIVDHAKLRHDKKDRLATVLVRGVTCLCGGGCAWLVSYVC